MPKSLRQLWEERGYSSAKQLADEIGVSTSTMSRYVSNPEEIPTGNACAIADALGVTVDEVLGRELPEKEPSELQRYYDSLDEDARGLFDEFVAFSKFRSAHPNDAKRQALLSSMDLARYYEDQLYNGAGAQTVYSGPFLYGSSEERRSAFESFVKDELDERSRNRVLRVLEQLQSEIEAGQVYVGDLPTWESRGFIDRSDPDFDDVVNHVWSDTSMRWRKAQDAAARSDLMKAMGGYDLLHPNTSNH